MRWLAFAATALGLLAWGVIVLVEHHGKVPLTVRVHRTAWELLQVGRSQRSLQLRYEDDGCARGHARAQVRETRSSVRIVLRQGYDEPGRLTDEFPCTSELSYATAVARLRRPLAGRRIEGGGRIVDPALRGLVRERHETLVDLVPRVSGLSPGDAVELLLRQGFRPRLQGFGRVVEQSPEAGSEVRPYRARRPRHPSVELRLGR